MLTKNIYPLTKQSISKTVFLPKTKFPQRHDPKTELKIQEEATFSLAYLDQSLARRSYVIHDGPPFANGQIHLGHAVNKILKDIAARYAMISGNRVEFIAGWDCHGLPIELQVLKQMENQAKEAHYGGNTFIEYNESPQTFRAAARQYAKSQIDMQMTSFKRMGLLTDWNKRYTTDDPSYVANQLRAFSQLYEQKLIFKDLMPVNWSLVNQNTVADADIDHRPDHISRAAYVLYEIVDPPFPVDVPGDKIYSLIWTTTPWTLLENEAIAFNKQATYCIVKIIKIGSSQDVRNLLLSFDSLPTIETLLQRLGYQYVLKTKVPGKLLAGLKYKPLLETLLPQNGERNGAEPRPFLEADFVDGTKGAGLVHISPNYGHEDHKLIKKNSMPIRTSLVKPDGIYDDQILQLANKHIFLDGNNEILNLLDSHNALLFSEQYQHSYPYETRTKSPIMTRTSQQIFLDTARIVPRCLKALESCSFFPENRKTHFINTLKGSPNWCISRQRLWGTPIPVLYDVDDVGQKNMISHPLLTEHFCKLLYKRRFMDYWWTIDNSELIPQELLDSCKLPCKSENLVRGKDIFDVWSDSGLSWHTTVNDINDSKNQSDLYLEGVDQIRGWFSSSSILSMALRGCLPTKRFFIHGFTLDETGRKMSKSDGNVTDPIELFERYGVDPIRLWVAKRASNHNNICVRQSEFEGSIEENVYKFRSTIRFLIGCLHDHDAVDGQLDHTKLEIFDQYILDKLYRFATTIDEHYKEYEYDKVVSTINDFFEQEWSPIYITSIKDHLYCDEPNSPRRKSTMIVLNLAYNIFLRCIYPIVPHIVHEAGHYMRSSEPLSDWQNLGHKASWSNKVLHDQFETLIGMRKILARTLGYRWDYMKDHDAILYVDDKKATKNLLKIVQSSPDVIAELFKTSTFIVSSEDKLAKSKVDSRSKDIEDQATKIEPNNQDQEHVSRGYVKQDIENSHSYMVESSQLLRVGGILDMEGAAPLKFEVAYRKSDTKKCPRCRRYCVLHGNGENNFCDRCTNVVNNLDL